MSNIVQRINDYALEEIMGDRFAAYAKEIIQDRALPDVRDGLKPVQRRILYAMYKEKNTYENKHRKSARAVGDIMGKYHPHGDSSIYDAMVRMSQNWKMMTPYIDMHGNNGSIDGDSAAAMRYTEARLSKISNELLKDIDKNTVLMAPNYDDTRMEPTVLPCKFPNLLVNGSTGISAGYATNIPTHNLGEIIDGTIMRIDKPKSTLEDIMTVIKGPDFPTGGIVEGINKIKEAFKTGKGKVIVKSKYHFTKEKGKEQIVITEIPYEVNKAMLVKKMNDIRIEKKIEGISEVRDESARDLRIVIDLKKGANKDLILNYLLKNTEMQINYSYNMVAIVNRRPELVGIIEIIDAYIAHEKEVVTKRTQYDLDFAKNKYHIHEGLMKAISILDEVIKTIRASKNRADATNNLIKEYDFTFEQADAIVKLQLYRLTNTDIVALQNEMDNLKKVMDMLSALLSDEKLLMKQIKRELLAIKKEYAVDRKTEIKEEITEIKIDAEAMIPKEDTIVVATKEGYIKRVSKKSYQASESDETGLKENDYIIGLYEMNTLNTLLMFTDKGNYLYIPVHEIPDLKWKDMGKHISNIISIKSDEKIIEVVPVYDFNKKEVITIFTKNGMIKRTNLEEFKALRYTKEISCIKLKENDEVVSVTSSKENEILVATKNGYGLWFKANEVTSIGLKASGVKAIKLDSNDEVVSGILFNESAEYITVFTDKMTAKRVKLSDLERSSRTRKGLLLIREVKTNPHKILKVFIVSVKDKFGLVNLKEISQIKNSEISINDRYSAGSKISKLKLLDVFSVKDLLSKKKQEKLNSNEEVIEVLEEKKKDVSLKEIDDRIMTIDDFLDNIDV